MISPSTRQLIEDIEIHSQAAIPALETEIYDGWHLRFARGHTRRANSVNVMAPGTLPLATKIQHCEETYKAARQPSHFRLTPLADSALEAALAARGYQYSDPTEVRLLDLSEGTIPDPDPEVSIQCQKEKSWLDALSILTGQSAAREKTFGDMLDRISLEPAYGSIVRNGRIVACGLAVMSADYVGLFEFVTDPAYLRRGLAAKIAGSLLARAKNRGVNSAYLQVVQSNAAAVGFWERLGFTERLYGYHYRSKS
ncbi:MAG: hypothetical protein COB93_05600 [Sneathiella sp.]|nr:MAG: hypothetical protein COB93_05600 [Sneathiella sp.]